jgi:predicted TIM-barrel fold metal-dependent hydrolase
MILDGHIHIGEGPVKGEDLRKKLTAAGVDGGVILSMSPKSFDYAGEGITWEKRLDNLFAWAKTGPELYPFYWIDPTEEDAVVQVKAAVEKGVAGFKVICNHFHPGDSKALKVYGEIAKAGKPLLFHSGILWDGKVSSLYNRPAEFEALLDIDGLKFALAHVSWPWYDENIAVYGKFLNAYSSRPDLSVEMFIDITPGTPPIYREEVLTKLFTVGYDIENNILFGTDCSANDYNTAWTKEWIARDNGIYGKLGLDENAVNRIYSGNLKRFLGINKEKIEKKTLKPGE